MAGVDAMTIQRLGEWKTLQMVQRYAHLSPDHKRQAVERLDSAHRITGTPTQERIERGAGQTVV